MKDFGLYLHSGIVVSETCVINARPSHSGSTFLVNSAGNNSRISETLDVPLGYGVYRGSFVGQAGTTVGLNIGEKLSFG